MMCLMDLLSEMYGKQVDDEVNRELKLWDEKLHEEGHRICKEHGFTTGFLEGGGAHSLVDSYELKVCLHTLTSKTIPITKSASFLTILSSRQCNQQLCLPTTLFQVFCARWSVNVWVDYYSCTYDYLN